MNPNTLFWTLALAWMAGMIAVAAIGWRSIRRGDFTAHRRAMNAAVWMLVGFLVAYVAKVATIGKEDLSAWTAAQLAILRIHETLVAVMLIAGTRARWLARRLAGGRDADATLRGRHRRAGRVALVAGLAALATAGLVLAAMWLR